MATASPEAKLATYRANCEGYGYQPATPDMAQCVQQEAGDYRAGAQANMAALGTGMARMSRPDPVVINQPVRLQTSCTTMGPYTNCY
jgi:hypothetical protein